MFEMIDQLPYIIITLVFFAIFSVYFYSPQDTPYRPVIMIVSIGFALHFLLKMLDKLFQYELPKLKWKNVRITEFVLRTGWQFLSLFFVVMPFFNSEILPLLGTAMGTLLGIRLIIHTAIYLKVFK